MAQLYHAASGQDFNIISCQNHGSVFGRDGASYYHWENSRKVKDCANDSAGILGNVTVYTTYDINAAQKFTINVSDCVNAPGVKIYSSSMASGIVGYFSTDTASSKNGGPIGTSTANIVLNIDRCRNYAETLVGGNNYIAGIFGDRYKDGTVAQDNTYIQNCYSVIGSDAGTSTGIVSLNNASLSSSLSGDKVGNNYYFFDTWGLTNTAGRIFDSSNTRNESRKGFSRMVAYGYWAGSDGKWANKSFAAIAGPQLGVIDYTDNRMYYNVTTANSTIDEHGIIRTNINGSDQITGRILFTMPDTPTYREIAQTNGHGASWLRPLLYQKNTVFNTKQKLFDEYVRENYRDMEHGQTDKKLDASFMVDLKQQTDGSFDVSIEDTDRPLYYEGTVLVDDKEVMSNLRFIPNQKGQGQWDPKLNGTQAYAPVRPAVRSSCRQALRQTQQARPLHCRFVLSVCLRIPRLLHGKLRRRRMCRYCRHRMSISDW